MNDYIQKYEKWLKSERISRFEKETLKKFSDQEVKECFSKYLDFGTGGIRAIMGLGINRLNKYMIHKITAGYALYLLEKFDIKSKNIVIVIAYDNRLNSKKFALEAAKVLNAYKINTLTFESLRPTPELSFTIRNLNANGGIVITASHNPKEYNGFKIYNEHGGQCIPLETQKISNYINSVKDELKIFLGNEETFQKYNKFIGKENDEKYYFELLKNIPLRKIASKNKLKIVFSPQHGTSLIPIKTVLERLNYEVIVVDEQANPDPNFSNTLSPNPEDKNAYIKSIDLAKKCGANLIITTDPDCDRIGVAVLHHNDFKLLTGNQTGCILLDYILKFYDENHLLKGNEIIYNTIVTSSLGGLIAKDYNIKVESTLTGFKYIGDKIHNMKKEDKFLFGYEESYGYLIKDFVRDKDAVQSSILIAEVANYYLENGLTLIDVLNQLYEKYGYFYDTLKSINFVGLDGNQRIKNVMSKLRKMTFSSKELAYTEDYLESIRYENGKKFSLNLPKSNVLKFIFSDDSWIAIRPSGTEPKCKFYFCIRGETRNQCKINTNNLILEIENFLGLNF